MNLIICTDNKGGIAFNKRRVSKDEEIMKMIKEITEGDVIYISPRSEALFTEYGVSNYKVQDIGSEIKNGYVFNEFNDLKYSTPSMIYNFCFNRDYPSDIRISISDNYLLDSVTKFKGKSHDEISLFIYKLGGSL